MRLFCVVLLLASGSLARYGLSGFGRSPLYPRFIDNSGTSFHVASHYPHSTGLSGNSNGNNRRNYNHNQPSSPTHHVYSSKTEVHHRYHYSPPRRITYGSTYHPVYHGTPPVYVYEYRDSGSRFDNLLTGLALYNLARLSVNMHDPRKEYSGTPGEICKLGIRKQTGEYEETRIDCKLIELYMGSERLPGQTRCIVKNGIYDSHKYDQWHRYEISNDGHCDGCLEK